MPTLVGIGATTAIDIPKKSSILGLTISIRYPKSIVRMRPQPPIGRKQIAVCFAERWLTRCAARTA